MKRDSAPARLDVIDFAETSGSLSGSEPVAAYARLAAEIAEGVPDALSTPLAWEAAGESLPGADGAPLPWLHLRAETTVPFVCQRCLAPVEMTLSVDRSFRFAPDEATATLEDETSEEDVLVAARDFDLRGLIEDELLMEIPITPRHDVCPEPVQLSAVDPAFEAGEDARANPFAVLGNLRPRKAE